MLTYDLSGPSPVLLDSIEVHPFYQVYSTAVEGDVAFAATGFRLDAVDLSDPSNLVIASTNEGIEAVAVGAPGGGYVAIETIADGTLLVDFSDLGNPVIQPVPGPRPASIRSCSPGSVSVGQ